MPHGGNYEPLELSAAWKLCGDKAKHFAHHREGDIVSVCPIWRQEWRLGWISGTFKNPQCGILYKEFNGPVRVRLNKHAASIFAFNSMHTQIELLKFDEAQLNLDIVNSLPMVSFL